MTLRVAWVGPLGSFGGLPQTGTLLVAALADTGAEVDAYLTDAASGRPAELDERPGVELIDGVRDWTWREWHGRRPALALAAQAAARVRAQRALARTLARRHARRPYDALVQFSQQEAPALGLSRAQAPPLVLHPCTSARAELRWYRAEADLARRCQTPLGRAATLALLTARSAAQRRVARRADLVLGPSRRFVDEYGRDYGVRPERLGVLRHPVDLDRFRPVPRERTSPLRLLFAARIAPRKGVELVVALSRRLADLAGRAELLIAGGPSLWADYRPLLADLDPSVARVLGVVTSDRMPALYADVDAVLVPSHFEPGSLVAGEALAAGLPVIASDVVGPTEVVDERVCPTFPAGDLAAFEALVRRLVDRLGADRHADAALARGEAERSFAPARIAGELSDRIARLR